MTSRQVDSGWRAFLVYLMPFVGLFGCGRSEADVRAEFETYVAGANSCDDASECAIAAADCPLGCFVIVRADRKDDIERKARDLVAQYQSAFQTCVYDCRPPGTLVCVDHRCGESNP